MANYFRITAYSPAEDVGMIVDKGIQDLRRRKRNEVYGRQYPKNRGKR